MSESYLKPSSILDAARSDLERRLRNAERYMSDQAGMEQYAFHRADVRKAKDIGDLMRRALQRGGYDGQKRATRFIYNDFVLLDKCIELVQTKSSQND
jgi:hypothetical protein